MTLDLEHPTTSAAPPAPGNAATSSTLMREEVNKNNCLGKVVGKTANDNEEATPSEVADAFNESSSNTKKM